MSEGSPTTNNENAATLEEYISRQENLIQEAAEALPHSFDHCTYPLGYIRFVLPLTKTKKPALMRHRTRQSVYLCLTCGENRGMCGACSVSCHTDHEQVELYAFPPCLYMPTLITGATHTYRFPKRYFRCDCPVPSTASKCMLHSQGSVIIEKNLENKYNQNFRDGGRFCRCHSRYDGQKENETMAQCLVCEVSAI
jgi:E3 ubiquitin-protein ligase UBR7